MARSLQRALTLLSALAMTVAVCALVAPSASARPTGSATPATSSAASSAKSSAKVRPACAASNTKGTARCLALVRTDITKHHGSSPSFTPDGYGPGDLKSAYKLPTTSGGGQTVAIVDAFDDPNAEADLAVYRSQYGLPACTTANGCFRKVNQRGAASPLPTADGGWALEISLDVDMVSAACPLCHILLVEADDNFTSNLAAAVDTAVSLGAKFVSNSYGGSEDPAQTEFDPFYDHPGVVVTASTGDNGFGTGYPATAPGVTAVGGTSLTTASNSRGWTESAWDGAGSGCSEVTPKPSFQHDPGCDNKSIADVSAVADPATGVAAYDTVPPPPGFVVGWNVVGGTSASSPIIASVYALGGTPVAGSNPESYPYAHTSNLFDVTSGSNGTCDPSYLCTSGPGYDGPTGLGTPNGVLAFRSGPSGNVVGTVKDAASGAPIAGAKVSSSTYSTVSATDGSYTLNLPTGTRTVTAAAYGYTSVTKTGIVIADRATVTQNFALAKIPTVPVSGAVIDGSGHGWPLYASISIDGAPGGPVYTDPFTGRYELSVPRNTTQTLTITPKYGGYTAKSVPIEVGSAPKNRSFSLAIADCSTPGYTTKYSGLVQHFDATTKPAGWTVEDLNHSGGNWTFTDAGQRGNTTGGSGNFAIIDSDHLGSGTSQDSALVTPVVDLSNDAHPVVGLNTFYRGFSNSTADIAYTVDGGTTWTRVFEATTDDVQGPLEIALPGAANKKAVQVRFRYRGTFAWWWEVDDVYVGHRTCAPVPAGLVAGFVKDGNTGLPVVGAKVTSRTKKGEFGITAATPSNPALADGFYHLVSTTLGGSTFTASKANYGDAARTVSVPSNYLRRSDFTLAAGRITPSAATLAGTATLGASTRTSLTLHNTGTLPVQVSLGEGKGTFVIADKSAVAAYRGVRGAAVHTVKGHFSPLREKGGAGQVHPTHSSTPSDAPWQAIADYPVPIGNNSASFNNGTLYSVGGFDGSDDVASLYSYSPDTNTWTKGADMSTTREAPSSAWIDGTLYVAGGWGPDGSPTGVTEAYDPTANAWTTLAPNPKPHAAAGAAVLDGKLYLTGGCDTNSCGSTDVQVYDPATNSWTSGPAYPESTSWESCGGIDGTIFCAGGTTDSGTSTSTYGGDGTSWTKLADMPADAWGAAYAAANGQLVVSGGAINGGDEITNQGWSYDPAANAWSSLPNSNNAFFRLGGACGFYKVGGGTSSFDPAHAESEVLPGYDGCSGAATDVPWLAEGSTDFTLAPGASKTVSITMDSSGLTQPGTYTATLSVGTDTPYPTTKIPVTFTVKPPSTWGKISGVVSGKACDGSTAPVAGATVEIDTWNGSYTLTTDANGAYALFLDYRNSPLTLIIAKDGWKPQTTKASVTAGGRTVRNFTLIPTKACG